jgi:hypothetical protein
MEHFISFQKGPWPERKGSGEGICRVPARIVAGGEEGLARELEEIKAHLLVCRDGHGVAGRSLVGDGQSAAAEGAHRWGGSSRGTAMRGGGLAKLGLGEAL